MYSDILSVVVSNAVLKRVGSRMRRGIVLVSVGEK